MKWKLSVGVSSSSCRSLNSPYITALVTVTDPSGAITSKSFEMTIGEFKVSFCKSEKSQMSPYLSLTWWKYNVCNSYSNFGISHITDGFSKNSFLTSKQATILLSFFPARNLPVKWGRLHQFWRRSNGGVVRETFVLWKLSDV